MHQALYRKWRPAVFDDVVGQEHITSVLRYEVEKGTFNHAYLFCGSRGTGKTTCAKILAKAVNCENPVNGSPCGTCASCKSIESGAATDVLEMDAASNNGVENIRDIRDEVVYTPSMLKYRVYIVDEVHMLSGSAFNALLKTLEEPPEHVIFILATTELQKLPATIISRCQRFDFRRITVPILTERLMKISQAEGFQTDPAAARLIARLAQGGMRDAISLLDLCSGNHRSITVELVEECAGITGRDTMIRTVDAIVDKNYNVIFDTIDHVVSSSKDLSVFWQDLLSIYRDLLVMKTTSKASKYLDLTEVEAEALASLAARFSKETLISHCKMLDSAFYNMQKSNASKRTVAEIALVRMCDESLNPSYDALLSRLSQAEDAIKRLSLSLSASSHSVAANWTGSDEGSFPPATEGQKEASRPDASAPVLPNATEKAKSAPNAALSAAESKGSLENAPLTPSSASEASASRPTLRPLRCKMEVAEKLAATDIPAASFLKSAHVFETAEGKILIRLSNDFAVTMLSRPQTRNALRAALISCLSREIPDKNICIERSCAEDEDKYDILDTLTEE